MRWGVGVEGHQARSVLGVGDVIQFAEVLKSGSLQQYLATCVYVT